MLYSFEKLWDASIEKQKQARAHAHPLPLPHAHVRMHPPCARATHDTHRAREARTWFPARARR